MPLPDWFADYVLMKRTGLSLREIDRLPAYRIEQLWTILRVEDEVNGG